LCFVCAEASRKQDEALIEQERKRAEAARQETAKAEEDRVIDRANGYKTIAVEEFVLDGKELSSGTAKVSMSGI
jgi:hypothetical protein